MSFSCLRHGWTHVYNSCPACGGQITQTADSVGVFKFEDQRDKIIADLRLQLQGLQALTAERDALKRENIQNMAQARQGVERMLERAEAAESSLASLRIALGEAVTVASAMDPGMGYPANEGSPLFNLRLFLAKIAKLSKAGA